MKIAVGADHAGYTLKERLLEKLKADGHEVTDFGTHSTESTDYPDFAAAVGRAVVKHEEEMGLLVCSSGVGMSIAANKIHGIRAALGVNTDEVSYTRRHNDANILAIGANYTDEPAAKALLDVFLRLRRCGPKH